MMLRQLAILVVSCSTFTVAAAQVPTAPDSTLTAARLTVDSTAFHPPGTLRLVLGGVVGGTAGVAAVWSSLPTAFHTGGGVATSDLYSGLVMLTGAESLGIALGACMANNGHGRLATSTVAAWGVGMAGLVLATGLSKGVGRGAFVIVPVSQIAAAIAVLR